MSPNVSRHAANVALAAVAIDAAYTLIFWLILGRPHRARRYFPILAQLSVEAALILHLREVLRQTRKVVEVVEAAAEEAGE